MNILITIAAIATMSTASVQEAIHDTDTVLSVSNASKVTVTESPAGVTVRIDGTDDDPGYQSTFTRAYSSESTVKSTQHITHTINYTNNQSPYHWDVISGGWGIGFAGTTGGAIPAAMGKSFEFQWLYMIGARYNLPHANLSFGLGLDWRNYKISVSGSRFIRSETGGVATAPYPDGVISRGSQIKIASLTLPVIWEQTLPVSLFGHHLQLAGGAILNWNYHGSIMSKWLDGDSNETEESSTSIGQHRFSVDLIGMMRVCSWAGFYFKYSPMTVLDSRSTGFNPFSTGIVVLY